MVREAFGTEALHYVMQRVFKMQVAICDDEGLFRDELRKILYEYSNERRLEFAIDEFSSGEDLLKSPRTYRIILLDYMMDGINGLETARALRERNDGCIIIFLTSYTHFVYDSFEVEAFRFIKKPLDVSKLDKALGDYFTLHGNSYPLLLKSNRDTVCVKTEEIVYLEADNKKCFIHLKDRTLPCARTMAAVARELPKSIFCKVNKAFIVNFNFISKYDNVNIYLKTTAEVPVSRKYFTKFKAAYRVYVKGRVV